MNIRFSVIFTTILMAAQTFGCWYNRISYNDYIYGVNSFERHAEATIAKEDGKATTTYHIENNMVVDFPVTVSVKLVSDSQVILDDETKKPELLRCALQYRVLPNGSWTTVEEYKVPTGKIPMASSPATYLGKNNVWPKKCKAGDVVMIRLYVTDGSFQSGDLADKCEDQLGYGKSTKFPDKYTLPDLFDYTPHESSSMIAVDLGGMWTPQYVVTVVYSGKTRPVQ